MQVKEGRTSACHRIFDGQEASMADGEQKDTYGYLGNEPTTFKELMSCLTDAVDKLVKNEGAATRAHLEKTVRERPLLSIAVAVAAGYLLASLRRR
jgi:ElaB/YqjD/DUF883 family membrane-anchored ribosome-binding protein